VAAETCRNCRMHHITRPRGLCWTCYYLPGVKDQFPSESKYGRRSEIGRVRGEQPAAPTRELPGTPEKVAVLEERAQLGQSLWHPEDERPLAAWEDAPLSHARQLLL
jgi:hypothetical protein